MKDILLTSAFKADFKRMRKRGKDATRLEAVVQSLASGATLPARNRPHPLQGVWKPNWECHIEPDWLLIYEVTETEVLLARTGTHADLFE